MVVMKMTHFEHIPDTCDDCIYNSCKPHPYKGWSDCCELCGHCMDDDQEDDWIYDGDGRPKNCPLMEIPTGLESEEICDSENSESKNEVKDLSKRVENIEKQIRKEKEEQLEKLKAEIDYAKFRCALPTIMDMMSNN